ARILIVDDNADMRTYLERLLRANWTVSAVRDAAGVLAAMRDQPVDLVLADVMMPGIDGLALLQTIRSDPPLKSTPVILLTACAGAESAIDGGLLAGADDYVVKPFAARELVARIGAQLQLSRVKAETARADKFRSSVIEALRLLDNPEQINQTLARMLRNHL